MQILNSKNPYYTLAFVKTQHDSSDYSHKFGAMIAIIMIRRVSGDDAVDTNYMTKYSADQLRGFARKAYELTHTLYGVKIDKSTSLPESPLFVSDTGDRYWQEDDKLVLKAPFYYRPISEGGGGPIYIDRGHKKIVPGELFDAIIYPYLYDNPSIANEWLEIIREMQIWPNAMLAELRQ
jgi:hypothetical protein